MTSFIDSKNGRFKTMPEVVAEYEAESEKWLEEQRNKPYYKMPSDYVNDWSGDKYLTTHRCFGERCKSDLEKEVLVQLDSSKTQPYGAAEADRDAQAGYAAKMDVDEDTLEEIRAHIDPKTGRHLTNFEVKQNAEAELEKELQKQREKPSYKVPEWVTNDWTGHKYLTTHRCFGHPCKSDEENL